MSNQTGSAKRNRRQAELLAVSERQTYLRLMRLGGLVIVAIAVLTNPAHRLDVVAPIWPAVAGYAGATLLLEGVWLLRRRTGVGPREVRLLTWMLYVDAAGLVWSADATGGLDSPLVYLVLAHAVGVVLLTSYRTGIKLAVWYCLLFVEEYFRAPAHLDGTTVEGLRTTAIRDVRLGAFLLALVLLTLVCAAAASISERELRRRRFDLEALSDLASDMERDALPADIGRTLLASLADNFRLERLVLVGPGPEPSLLARSGLVAREVMPLPFGPRSMVTRTVAARTTQLIRAFDPEQDPWLCSLIPDARNLVLVPLTTEGGCQGVLVFEYDRRSGSRVERRMISIVERFAGHTALSLRNALLLEQVRRVAAVDGLTAIPNRRTFEEELERETVRATRTGEPVSLIMIDIDHFKALNDTYGHQVGDEVLRQVARILTGASRDYDVVARYGGEEFAVIVPSCGREEAAASAERLLDALRRADTSVAVTASLGVATYPDDASSSNRLVDRADQALYAAKRTGRDRVETYPQVLAAQIEQQALNAS